MRAFIATCVLAAITAAQIPGNYGYQQGGFEWVNTWSSCREDGFQSPIDIKTESVTESYNMGLQLSGFGKTQNASWTDVSTVASPDTWRAAVSMDVEFIRGDLWDATIGSGFDSTQMKKRVDWYEKLGGWRLDDCKETVANSSISQLEKERQTKEC